MSHRRLAVLAAAAALAGCGTPAVVKPVQNPLPGFKQDIQSAHSAVNQVEQQAQSLSNANVSAP